LKTFPIGGVHPPENKLTSGSEIQYLPVPASVAIPVVQHIGGSCFVIVNKDEKVKTGQVIAQSKGFVSSNIHSSVSGKVTRIDTIIDSTGYKQTAVFITTEGDEWMDTIDRSSEIITEIKLSPEEIIKRCLESGIVGLGGATFPSQCKAYGTCREEMRRTDNQRSGVRTFPYVRSPSDARKRRGDTDWCINSHESPEGDQGQ